VVNNLVYWFIFSDALYRPTISVEVGNDGVSVLVNIQPPSPVLPMATIVNYQVIVSNSDVEETMTISSTSM